MFNNKKKKTTEVVVEKNRKSYYKQANQIKRNMLVLMIGFSIAFIAIIGGSCWLLLKAGEYSFLDDIVVYIGLPISVLGASVITVITLNYMNLVDAGIKHPKQKQRLVKFFILFFFISVVILYITEIALTDNGLKRLWNDRNFEWVLLGKLIISVIGSILIVVIDESFKQSFKDSFLIGLLPISKKRRLIIRINRSNTFFKYQKENLFDLNSHNGAQFDEKVNQYINDIIKEYKKLSESKLLKNNPELIEHCKQNIKKWISIRKSTRGRDKNEVLGMIGSEQHKDIAALFDEIKKLNIESSERL